MSKDRIHGAIAGSGNLVLLVLCLLGWYSSFAQEEPLNSLDLYQLDSPVKCSFTLVDQDDSVWVYTSIQLIQPVSDSSLWIRARWYMDNTVFHDSAHLVPNQSKFVLKWGFTGQTLPYLITIELDLSARTWIFQEHFPLSAYHQSDGLLLQQENSPVFRSWIHSHDSVFIASTGRDKIYSYYYNHRFEPARPPMTVRAGKGNAALEIDSLLILSPNMYFTPTRSGLYFFQNDSSSTLGTAIFVADEYYPQPKTITELTEPLIYITTRAEYDKISEDLSSKRAFDKFWLSTVGSPDKARRSIKNYYHNIEAANALFTSYKEGWKTDRGMIYTVMGPPLTVIKDNDSETWSYMNRTNEQLDFTFKKIPNLFSNNHYELIRDKSYDRQWFFAIDRWRQGQTK